MLGYTNHIIKINTKEGDIMPLTFVNAGEQYEIKRIGGKGETRKFLENLGFTTGGIVKVISESGGNIIVSIKDSRVAIGKDLAGRIIV